MNKTISMIFLAAFIPAGCDTALDQRVTQRDGGAAGKALVRIGIETEGQNTAARTVYPYTPLSEVAVYKLDWTGTAENTVTFINDEDKKIEVEPGAYTFTLRAYRSFEDKDDNKAYLQAQLKDKVISAAGGTLSFTLATLPSAKEPVGTTYPKGDIRITLDISGVPDAGIAGADVWLADSVGSGMEFEITLTAGNGLMVFEKIGQNAADIKIQFNLKDEKGYTVGTITETVQVRKEFTSKKTIAVSGADLTALRTGALDGSWAPVPTLNLGTSENFTSIVYKNNRFMAGTNKRNIWYSDDGVNWTEVVNSPFASDTTTAAVNAIDYGGCVWVAVGAKGTILRSEDDGVTWTAATTNPFGTNAVNSVAFGNNNRWIAGGASVILAESTDGGKIWTQVPVSERGAISAAPAKIFYAGNTWIATGNASGGYYSTDGRSWTQGSTLSRYALAYTGNRFWAASGTSATNRALAASTDGITWEEVSFDPTVFSNPPTSYNAMNIVYGNSGWVMSNTRNSNIAYSPDLVTWTRSYDAALKPGEKASCIAYGNKTWVITGDEGSVSYFKEQ